MSSLGWHWRAFERFGCNRSHIFTVVAVVALQFDIVTRVDRIEVSMVATDDFSF
jgi:hypothetical protein